MKTWQFWLFSAFSAALYCSHLTSCHESSTFWTIGRHSNVPFDVALLKEESQAHDLAKETVVQTISSFLNEAGFLSADIVAFRHPSGSFSSLSAAAGSIFFAKLTFNQVHDRSTIIQLFRARSDILLLSLSDREMIFEDEITRKNVEQMLSQLESRQNNCQNGGVQLQDNTCACPNYFTGDFCEQRVCLNGGYTIASYPRCVCPPGYHGLHCEPLPCSPATQFTFDFQQKTLVVVFEARDSMAIDLQGLISALSSVTNFFQTNRPGYYDSYQITTVVQPDTNPGIIKQTIWYRSSSDFLSSLQNVVLLSGNCNQPILTGILDAIQHSPYTHAKSPYFIFVDALASDIDMEEQVRTAALAWGVQLFFITSQLPSSGCSLDIADPGFQVYLNLARATQGEVIQLQYNKADVESLVNLVVPLLYQETTIAAANYAACPANGKSDNFTVDSSATELLIFSTGGAFLLSNGKPLTPQNTSGDLNIFSMPTSTNNVEVQSVSSGNCGYRVFVQSTNSILVSYTPNPSIDSYSTIMTAGLPFSAVARSTTVPLPTNLSLAFFNDDDETPLFTPNFSLTMQRSTDCIFPTLFEAWSSCAPGPLNVKLYAQVPGIGSIERVYPGYCHDFQLVPTTTASPITCQNGGTPLAHACGCPQYFGGKFCEIIQCINGGIMKYAPDGTSYCSCQLGYTGLHCEMLTCNETSSSVLGGSNDATHRDLSVVILNRISMASYQSEWRYGFENFTGWYDANQPNYFDNYYITTFIAKANSSGFVYNIINKLPFTTSAAFRSQIRGLGLTVSTVTTGQPVLSAIQRTIVDNSGNIAIKKRSPMFIFVDDEPSDVYLLRSLELLVVQSQVQASFFF
uniref:EGF-like domain-containing protein n=1 Tax=Plectus sambesii TaxID=2011161 RepID=A0A914X2I4_9BILA